MANVSLSEDSKDYDSIKLSLRASFAAITAVLSVISNAICLVVLPQVTNIPENNRLFLLSLTVSDFASGVGAFIYIEPAAYGKWVYPDFLCDCMSFCMSVFAAVSIVCLICLTIDKYIAIRKPLRYLQLVTRRRVLGVIIFTWILCAVDIACLYSPLLSGPPVLYQVSAAACGPDLAHSYSLSLLLLIGITTVLLPLALISFIYIHLYKITRKQIRELQARLALNQDDHITKTKLTGEGKAIRMFAAISVTYAVVWTPYFVAITYKNLTMIAAPWLDFMGFWLVISGSWCDAAILAGMSSAFRKSTKRLFDNILFRVGMSKRRKQTVPIEGTNATSCNSLNIAIAVAELDATKNR